MSIVSTLKISHRAFFKIIAFARFSPSGEFLFTHFTAKFVTLHQFRWKSEIDI